MRSKRWTPSAGVVVLLLLLAACGPAAKSPAASPTPSKPSPATATPTAAASAVAPLGKTPTPKPSPAPAETVDWKPVYGGVARFPQREDPPTWDPALTHVDPNISTKTAVFTKLFTMWTLPPADCKEEVTPYVVRDWKWIDDVTAEFVLREGIKFHNKPPVNGRELVAEDVVFSLERYKLLPYMQGVSALVASVEATGRHSFRMKTVQPWGGMPLELLAHDYGPFPLAKEAGGAKQELWTDPHKSWIGVGPFMFDRWLPGVKWSLTRNPSYWQEDKPYLDRVELVVMPDTSTQMAALRSGNITGMSLRGTVQLLIELQKQLPTLQVVNCADSSARPAVLYMNNTAPPFNDVRVRRAISMAVDRQAIIDTFYLGQAGYVAVLRPGLPYAMAAADFPAEVRSYLEHRPDEARKLLAEAGYPSGFKTAINVTSRYEAPFMAISEMLAGMLQKVGIQAELKLLEYGRYAQTVLRASYPEGEMATTPGAQWTPEDAAALRSPSKYGGTVNRSMVNDTEYDKLYEDFIGARDKAKRLELARQLQVRHVDQAYRVLLPYGMFYQLGPANLKGMYARSGFRDWGPWLENMWFAR